MILASKILLGVVIAIAIIMVIISLCIAARDADDNNNYDNIYSHSEGGDHESKKNQEI